MRTENSCDIMSSMKSQQLIARWVEKVQSCVLSVGVCECGRLSNLLQSWQPKRKANTFRNFNAFDAPHHSRIRSTDNAYRISHRTKRTLAEQEASRVSGIRILFIYFIVFSSLAFFLRAILHQFLVSRRTYHSPSPVYECNIHVETSIR